MVSITQYLTSVRDESQRVGVSEVKGIGLKPKFFLIIAFIYLREEEEDLTSQMITTAETGPGQHQELGPQAGSSPAASQRTRTAAGS